MYSETDMNNLGLRKSVLLCDNLAPPSDHTLNSSQIKNEITAVILRKEKYFLLSKKKFYTYSSLLTQQSLPNRITLIFFFNK
jgi:hypothetical protein